MIREAIVKIDNLPRAYSWGAPGAISRLLGRTASDQPEAELWLGAHPSCPSRVIDPAPWGDLIGWEDAHGQLPFLLKILAAEAPLSLQAHPAADTAREGFDRENTQGLPPDAAERNYRDPHAKPELIVALEDGFQALCGFRSLAETIPVLEAISDTWADVAPTIHRWIQMLKTSGIQATFRWLIEGGPDIAVLAQSLTIHAAADPGRFPLLTTLSRAHPDDAGITAALMLHHLELRAGDSLWLAAGNIHAYLSGIGIELMGPSDNVMRGGLTGKHIDQGELIRILDFTPGPPAYLTPQAISDNARVYRPHQYDTGRDAGFELLNITGPAKVDLAVGSILAVIDGSYRVSVNGASYRLSRGEFAITNESAAVDFRGDGVVFIATAAS